MTTEQLIRMLAGTLVLLSLALGVEASPAYQAHAWLWLATFVGANLLQSSVTGFCPAEIVFRKLGARSAADPAR